MTEIFENLFDKFEQNCKNAELESINYVINKEYPIVSFFTMLNREQIIEILKDKRYQNGLTRYERCLFVTLWLDAISCTLKNCFDFGAKYETYRIIKLLLDAVRIHFSVLHDTDCSPSQRESLIKLIRDSENRLQNTAYSNYFVGISNFCQNITQLNFMHDSFKENVVDNLPPPTSVPNKVAEIICVDDLPVKPIQSECVSTVSSDKKRAQKSILSYFGKKEPKIVKIENNVVDSDTKEKLNLSVTVEKKLDFTTSIESNVDLSIKVSNNNTPVKNAFEEMMRRMNSKKVNKENV